MVKITVLYSCDVIVVITIIIIIAVSQMDIEVWSIVKLNLSFLEDTFTKFSAIVDENNFYFLFKHIYLNVCVCMGGCVCLCIK